MFLNNLHANNCIHVLSASKKEIKNIFNKQAHRYTIIVKNIIKFRMLLWIVNNTLRCFISFFGFDFTFKFFYCSNGCDKFYAYQIVINVFEETLPAFIDVFIFIWIVVRVVTKPFISHSLHMSNELNSNQCRYNYYSNWKCVKL